MMACSLDDAAVVPFWNWNLLGIKEKPLTVSSGDNKKPPVRIRAAFI